MENQTGFNLNEALAKWRAEELESQPGISADTARELESHLRDSVADLQNKGLPVEEAFWLAQRRLGSPEKLVAEITKADPARLWTERVIWMAAGVLAMKILPTLFIAPWLLMQRSWNASLHVPLNAVMYILIVSLALLVARGKLPRSRKALLERNTTSKRLFGVVALTCILQVAPVLIQLWNEWENGRLSTTGWSHNMVFWNSTIVGILWPLVVCYLLVHLRHRLTNTKAT